MSECALKQSQKELDTILEAKNGEDNATSAFQMKFGSPCEEKFMREATQRGWKVYRQGYPDFILERDNIRYFVEVKSKQDKVSTAQKQMFSLLFKMNCPVTISIDGEWVEPSDFSIFFGTIKLQELRSNLDYYVKKLSWLKEEIGKTTSLIDSAYTQLETMQTQKEVI